MIELSVAIKEIKSHYRVLTNILTNSEKPVVIIKISRNLIKELRVICKLAYYLLTSEDLKEVIRMEEHDNDN